MSDFDTAQAAAEAIVAPALHLLAPAEHKRMVSSLMIDLDHGTYEAALNRALRLLERTRMQAENARYSVVSEGITEIFQLIRARRVEAAPIAAAAHITPAASAASVLTSWFSTAHVHLTEQPYFRSSARRDIVEVFA